MIRAIYATPGVAYQTIDTSVVIPPPPPPGINVGDTIEVTIATGVRATPVQGAAQLPGGNQPVGARGTVRAGPVTEAATGLVWFDVLFQSGPSGFVRELRIREVTAVVGPPAPTISNLRATPPSLPVGGGTVLIDATVTDATTVRLNGVYVTLPFALFVPLTNTHTLTASGPTAPIAQAQVTVPVAVAPVGSGPLSTLQPRFARNLGPYVPASSVWGSKEYGRTDFSGLAYDAPRKQLVFFGGGHGQSQMTDLRLFSLTGLTWSSAQLGTLYADMTLANLDVPMGRWVTTSQPTARHTYNMCCVVGNRYYMMAHYGQVDYIPGGGSLPYGGRPCWYDFVTGVWGFSQVQAPWIQYSAAAYDPVSGHIFVIGLTSGAGAPKLWSYDPASDAITFSMSVTVGAGIADLIYCPTNDRFYYIAAGGGVSEIAFSGSSTIITPLTATGTPPPAMGSAPVGFAYDTVNHIIGGHVLNGTFYAFAPSSKVWTATAMQVESGSVGIPNQAFHCIEFDPDSGCFVLLANDAAQKMTWGYRHG